MTNTELQWLMPSMPWRGRNFSLAAHGSDAKAAHVGVKGVPASWYIAFLTVHVINYSKLQREREKGRKREL